MDRGEQVYLRIMVSVQMGIAVYFACRARYELSDGSAVVYLFGSLLFALFWLRSVTAPQPNPTEGRET